jgi:hypothetical protein
MGVIQPSTCEFDHRQNDFPVEERFEQDAPEVWPEVDALLIRNSAQLTELVARLATLVIRNVVEES